MAAVDTTGYHLASPRFETAQQVMDNAVRITRLREKGREPILSISTLAPAPCDKYSHAPANFARANDPFETPPPFPRIITIQKEVCKHFKMTMPEMLARRRDARTVLARHVSMYLAHILTPHSYPEIGRRFGRMDHTTILSGCRKMKRVLPNNPDLQATVETLTKILVPEPVL